MRYLCKILARVSSRGITFLQQVDDYGSGAYPKHGKVVFESAFPSTCPWVSGVGTTVWDREDGVEKATTWATRGIQAPGLAALSSGLFSQTFGRPKWQDKFVQPYLNKFKLAETCKWTDEQNQLCRLKHIQ
jgi:subtilase family serine protease